MLNSVTQSLFSLVFPLQCELCDCLLPSHLSGGVCERCDQGLSRITPPFCPGCGRHSLDDKSPCGHCREERLYFDRALACMIYQDRVKELLRRFKFGNKRYLENYFAKTMTSFLQGNIKTDWDVVIPVPMDNKRECDRGYNQAKRLARLISKKLGIPHVPNALGSSHSSQPQSFLKKEERRSNVLGRFFVRRPNQVRSKKILLVDDILTTGHTASECSKILKEAGASHVTAFAFARGA